ncbi:hypothetical protein N9E79_00760 [bacterium]|nr:hypothetical protein [bacterium]
MKVIITESKINDVIRKYLYQNYMPDTFSRFDTETPEERFKFFKNKVYNEGLYHFYKNGEESWSYFGDWDGAGEVGIEEEVEDELNGLFGDKWIPVFKGWFEEITGLEVGAIVLNTDTIRFD